MAKRLFIALELPAGCREALAAVAIPIPGVRWVPADQLHLTLVFMGDLDTESERRLRGRLAELQVSPFELRLHGVGMFRARRRAVIWAGVEDAHEDLLTLHGELHRALKAARQSLASKPMVAVEDESLVAALRLAGIETWNQDMFELTEFHQGANRLQQNHGRGARQLLRCWRV